MYVVAYLYICFLKINWPKISPFCEKLNLIRNISRLLILKLDLIFISNFTDKNLD